MLRTYYVCVFLSMVGFMTTPSSSHAFTCTNESEQVPYNAIITFNANPYTCIYFPDFILRYAGIQSFESHGMKREIQLFDVRDDTSTQRVEWYSTGEAAAITFTAKGQEFFLELHSSLLPNDKGTLSTILGRNQLAVLTKERYDTLMDEVVMKTNQR